MRALESGDSQIENEISNNMKMEDIFRHSMGD